MRRRRIGFRHGAGGIMVALIAAATMCAVPAVAAANVFHDSEATSGSIGVGIRGGAGGSFNVREIGLEYKFEAVSTNGGLVGIGTSGGSFTTLTFHGVSVPNEECEVRSPGSPAGTVTTKALAIEMIGADEIEFKPASGQVMFEMDVSGEECGVSSKNQYTGTFNATIEDPTTHGVSHALKIVPGTREHLKFGAHEITLTAGAELFTLANSLLWVE